MAELNVGNGNQYWVVGGIYTGTDFDKMEGSDKPERHGPFHSYAEAFSQWSRLAWKTVDDAHARYRIVKSD